MTMDPVAPLGVDDIRLGEPEFWSLPRDAREGAFQTLRRERPISFHEETEIPILGKGPGFWALTRHADILHVSRTPEVFSSAGSVTIVDQPAK